MKNNEEIKFKIEVIPKNIAQFLFSYPPIHDRNIISYNNLNITAVLVKVFSDDIIKLLYEFGK